MSQWELDTILAQPRARCGAIRITMATSSRLRGKFQLRPGVFTQPRPGADLPIRCQSSCARVGSLSPLTYSSILTCSLASTRCPGANSGALLGTVSIPYFHEAAIRQNCCVRKQRVDLRGPRRVRRTLHRPGAKSRRPLAACRLAASAYYGLPRIPAACISYTYRLSDLVSAVPARSIIVLHQQHRTPFLYTQRGGSHG